MFLIYFNLLKSFGESHELPSNKVHLRINQVGYLMGESKIAIAFSLKEVTGFFNLVDVITGKKVFKEK